ncbi:response regulator [Litoreibacter albidus]|uniref:Two-component system, OmpR family, response regulator n=1 Tax=Litoreibacter albidus TaxID=670155 RepID=A0A1H3CU03_9RHOB|nr:response regulator transcription factor [Litoreibacter albidus]SDX57540.1 two-component system, OmpR family, response regulator [Litoreibacter albidus]
MDHILVIDDDPEILELLQQFLQRQGLQVSTGASGDDLWAALEDNCYDLVILDVLLPGVDGLTLCRELRAKSDVPIVILTALDEETDRIVGLEVGADDYLVKPFSPRELLARIRAIFRRAALGSRNGVQNEPKVFTFEQFRFDVTKHELRAPNDVVIHLSRTEFDLLRLFVKRSHEAIDRNDISEHLRGHELGAFDRSVDLHVSRLRTKLAPLLGVEDFIRTIRGTGYMFTLDVDVLK